MSSSDVLKKLIWPIQSSGYSLSDFIKAYLENAKLLDLYDSKELKAIFGENLYRVEKPLYKSGTYDYKMISKDGPKHVEKIEFLPKYITEMFTQSSHLVLFIHSFHPLRH